MQEHSEQMEHRVQPVKAVARGTDSGIFKAEVNPENVSFVNVYK